MWKLKKLKNSGVIGLYPLANPFPAGAERRSGDGRSFVNPHPTIQKTRDRLNIVRRLVEENNTGFIVSL